MCCEITVAMETVDITLYWLDSNTCLNKDILNGIPHH